MVFQTALPVFLLFTLLASHVLILFPHRQPDFPQCFLYPDGFGFADCLALPFSAATAVGYPDLYLYYAHQRRHPQAPPPCFAAQHAAA